jgi:hypothetical protein
MATITQLLSLSFQGVTLGKYCCLRENQEIMLKLLKLFAWMVFGVALFVASDQLMVRVPMAVPGVAQAQTFYVDFRSRLLGLVGFTAPRSAGQIERLIDANKETRVDRAAGHGRFLYVDGAGNLQFADSLQQVPEAYRKSAQPLAE